MSRIQYRDDIRQEVQDALLSDPLFQFKRKGDFFRHGVCPLCKDKSVWAHVNSFTLQCDHINNCQYEEHVRDIYPDIFDNFSKRAPATDADPMATAKAYLSQNRFFNVTQLSGEFTQAYFPFSDGHKAPTVRFPLWDGFYWERFIDKQDTRRFGAKAHFKKGIVFTGKCWQPKSQTIKKNDTVFIVEGIFHAIALIENGHKAIAAFTNNNLPTEIIKQHEKNNITWVLAYDDDVGTKNATRNIFLPKYIKQLKKQGVNFKVFLMGKKVDWDDLHRLEKINEKTIKQGLFTGAMFASQSIEEKAWVFFQQYQSKCTVLDFEYKLFACEC